MTANPKNLLVMMAGLAVEIPQATKAHSLVRKEEEKELQLFSQRE
jgi:hypothetical protein